MNKQWFNDWCLSCAQANTIKVTILNSQSHFRVQQFWNHSHKFCWKQFADDFLLLLYKVVYLAFLICCHRWSAWMVRSSIQNTATTWDWQFLILCWLAFISWACLFVCFSTMLVFAELHAQAFYVITILQIDQLHTMTGKRNTHTSHPPENHQMVKIIVLKNINLHPNNSTLLKT